MNRTGLCWTLCVFIGPTTPLVTLSCTPPSWSGIHNTLGKCVSHRVLLCRGNCSSPIARTWCLSARLGYLMALFSSEWITSGSANFCSCSKSIQRQTLACSTTSVPTSLCWKSTRAHGNQVILCIFYILCIFWFVYRPQPGWISVNLQSSTNAANKHKSSMWFQFPQYSDAFLLFQWGRPGQFPSPCDKNRLTFPELAAINQQAVVMVVGGGT